MQIVKVLHSEFVYLDEMKNWVLIAIPSFQGKKKTQTPVSPNTAVLFFIC